jgi:PST family polysaccharide transporter
VTLFRNLLSLTGAELAGKLLTFAAFAYLARVAGPDGFGFVEFALSVLLCASLLVDQGFSPYGAREIAKAPQHTSALVSEIVGARCLLALGAYAAVALLAWNLERGTIIPRLLLLYGVSLFAMPFLLQWVFQGHDRMTIVATSQVVRQATFAGVVFAGVHQPAHLWVVAAAEVAAVASAAGYTVIMYRRRFGRLARPRFAISGQLLREGVPIGLSQMFWVARMVGATFIVGLVAVPTDLGFFAGAQRILVALHAFVWLYFFNLLPTMARAWHESPATFHRLIATSLRGVAWCAAGGGLVWVAFAPAAMRIAYGSAFAPAGPTLAWLAGVCVGAAVSGHYRFGLIAAGRQTAEMLTSALGAVAAVSLIPLGYRLAGPSGVAMALCAAEAVVWGSAWWCGRQLLGLRQHVALLWRPVLVAALALLIFWATPLVSVILRLVLALAAFVTLALLLDRRVLLGLGTVRGLLQRSLWPENPARFRGGTAEDVEHAAHRTKIPRR